MRSQLVGKKNSHLIRPTYLRIGEANLVGEHSSRNLVECGPYPPSILPQPMAKAPISMFSKSAFCFAFPREIHPSFSPSLPLSLALSPRHRLNNFSSSLSSGFGFRLLVISHLLVSGKCALIIIRGGSVVFHLSGLTIEFTILSRKRIWLQILEGRNSRPSSPRG